VQGMSTLLLHSRSHCTSVEKCKQRGVRGHVKKSWSGGRPMEVSRDVAKFARSRPVIECAQCGERIYIPEWSECLEGSRVRHLWQCDACGTSFETTVRIAAA
jgi:hypothetical protein